MVGGYCNDPMKSTGTVQCFFPRINTTSDVIILLLTRVTCRDIIMYNSQSPLFVFCLCVSIFWFDLLSISNYVFKWTDKLSYGFY